MMADTNSGLGWSDAQWEMVNNAVSESFAKASVAGAFLPCYGPLPASAEYVRDEQLTAEDEGAKVLVTDDKTVKLFNLTVRVELSREQVSDDALSSALLAFRRAANTLAQVEDDIVFNGFVKHSDDDDVIDLRMRQALRAAPVADRTKRIAVSGPDSVRGLDRAVKPNEFTKFLVRPGDSLEAQQEKGEKVVNAVADAIATLEGNSHPGPFACVLGKDVFVAAHTPSDGLVLPADRITPLLNGPLLRSGEMRRNAGIVVSLASGSIDIVVATPPKVQFLQVNGEAKYLFRVYERFILRIKDLKKPAVFAFEIEPRPDGANGGDPVPVNHPNQGNAREPQANDSKRKNKRHGKGN
jgi:uncharacterized linocin/CFP29 family protein